MFYDLPIDEKDRKKLLKSFLTEMNRKYVIQIGYTKNTNTEEYRNVWEKAILLTIDFLVSSDNYDYLFNEMFKIMEHFGQKNSFISNLEPFILHNRIKYMPNETLREVIYYYKDHNKPDVLQYLIINIDLESIDIGFLITLCIENQLYVPLMYICTRSDPPDFMTPLVKMFSEYKHRLEEKSSNSYDMGMKCLWFIDLTLRGKMFPDTTIEVELWKTKVIETIIWAFDQQILSLLIVVNPFIAYEIFYMVFDKEISDVIETSNENITIYSGSNVPTEHRKLLFGDIQGKNITLCDMITLIYESSIDIKEAETLLYYFLAKMYASYNFPLKLNIVKEIIVYILKNDKVVPKWTKVQSKQIVKKSTTLEMILDESDDDDNDDINENYRVDLILVILRKLHGKLTKDDLEKFKDIVMNEPDLY